MSGLILADSFSRCRHTHFCKLLTAFASVPNYKPMQGHCCSNSKGLHHLAPSAVARSDCGGWRQKQRWWQHDPQMNAPSAGFCLIFEMGEAWTLFVGSSFHAPLVTMPGGRDFPDKHDTCACGARFSRRFSAPGSSTETGGKAVVGWLRRFWQRLPAIPGRASRPRKFSDVAPSDWTGAPRISLVERLPE